MKITNKYGLKLSILLTLPLVFSSCGLGNKPPLAPNKLMAAEDSETRLIPDQKIPGTNPLELLKLKQVQEELALTSDQINNLKQIETEFKPKVSLPASGNSPPSPEEAYNQQRQSEKSRGLIAKLLNSEQITRFEQITLQIYGWGVMSQEEFSETLVLSPEQNQQIDQIRFAINEKMKTAFQKPLNSSVKECQKTVTKNFQQLKQINEETSYQIAQILSKEQQKILGYLRGDKFDLNLNQLSILCQKP